MRTRPPALRPDESTAAPVTLSDGLKRSAQGHRIGERRTHQRIGHCRSEAARDAFGDAFALSEVDDVFGLDDLSRDVVDAAEGVGESELDAAGADPQQAGEEVRRFLQPLAPALPHDADELL